MEGYSVTIVESSKELTAKEKIALKDYSNATPLDTALDDVDVLSISPAGYTCVLPDLPHHAVELAAGTNCDCVRPHVGILVDDPPFQHGDVHRLQCVRCK